MGWQDSGPIGKRLLYDCIMELRSLSIYTLGLDRFNVQYKFYLMIPLFANFSKERKYYFHAPSSIS